MPGGHAQQLVRKINDGTDKKASLGTYHSAVDVPSGRGVALDVRDRPEVGRVAVGRNRFRRRYGDRMKWAVAGKARGPEERAERNARDVTRNINERRPLPRSREEIHRGSL